MITGQVALIESGIAPSHRPAFQQIANELDMWIMVRNVNKLCTSLIEHNYPTKGMSVHGKSSDWGPQAGLICRNQELSKYQGKPRVPALNQEVEHSLGGHGMGDVKAAPLVVPKWRLDELEQLGLIQVKWTFVQSGHGRYTKEGNITCTNRPHTFRAIATGPANQDFSILVRLHGQGNGEPVNVIFRTHSLTGAAMTDMEGRLPLTADYDLFNICASFKVLDLGGDDRFQNARADLPEINRFALNKGVRGTYDAPPALNRGQSVQRLTSAFDPAKGRIVARWEGDLKTGQGHKVRGHITIRQNQVRQRLNAIINSTYRGGDTVHHGAETMNPFPEADDFGITIFKPRADPVGLQNLPDLNSAYEQCRAAGYYFHVNPLWGWKPWGRDFGGNYQMRVNENVRSVPH
jgi:anthrax edema toxin adenylate cyclase